MTAVTKRDKNKRKQEIGDDVHFSDGHTLGLSGAIGASSQQEISGHFNLIISEMTLLWTGWFYICVMQPFLHFLSSVSFVLVTTVRGKHIIKKQLAWTYINISNNATGGRSNTNNRYLILSAYCASDISLSILHVLNHFTLIPNSRGRCYYDPDFIDEEIEAQKD